MKDLLNKTHRGFTIIEVMIVLAIAGLIMVIVFIAVPQLQRNQRDNARQNIVNRLKAEMETYAGNNQGEYPFKASCSTTGCWQDFYNRYVSGDKVNVKDPSLGTDVVGPTLGQPLAYSSPTAPALPATKGIIAITYGAKCSGELWAASGSPSTSARTYAIMIGLDRDGTRYCVDNG